MRAPGVMKGIVNGSIPVDAGMNTWTSPVPSSMKTENPNVRSWRTGRVTVPAISTSLPSVASLTPPVETDAGLKCEALIEGRGIEGARLYCDRSFDSHDGARWLAPGVSNRDHCVHWDGQTWAGQHQAAVQREAERQDKH